MYSTEILQFKDKLKISKAFGTKFVTKLEDKLEIFVHDKNTNNIFKIEIVRDKRTEDKYFIKTNEFEKGKFIANGDPQMIFYDPIIIAKVGATVKSKENIYFTVDDNIDLYI